MIASFGFSRVANWLSSNSFEKKIRNAVLEMVSDRVGVELELRELITRGSSIGFLESRTSKNH